MNTPYFLRQVLFSMAALLFVSAELFANQTLTVTYEPGMRVKDRANFAQTLRSYTEMGIYSFVFEPSQAGLPILKVGGLETVLSTGDFYFLVGLSNNDTDRQIRQGDYNDIYTAVNYLSWYRFRVIVQLQASLEDLKAALHNDRPTIILWDSHGNQKGIYDANTNRIPYSIFQDASKNVYQFINGACYGEISLRDHYNVPKHIQTYAWSGLVTVGMLSEFLNSDNWSAFTNYPVPLTKNGMSCTESEESSQMLNEDGKAMIGERFSKKSSCILALVNSNEGFTCAVNPAGKYNTISIPQNAFTPGLAYEELKDCLNRLNNAANGKICRRIEDDSIRAIESSTNRAIKNKVFTDMNECAEYIYQARDA